MARVDPTQQIEFSSPAKIDELIEALEDLRAQFGNDADVRVACFAGGMSIKRGGYVRKVTADREALDITI